MGLFRKNDESWEQDKKPANPNNMVIIRVLAVGYLLWSLWQMIQMYLEGGEEAPSLGLLIAAIVLFGAGSVWICVISYKQYKQMKAAQQAAYEEEERLEMSETDEETEE